MSAPPPSVVVAKLRRMIQTNERPATFIHAFLVSGKPESNLIANYMRNNKEAIKLITSPAGRKWIANYFNDTLNYLQKIAESY